MPAEYSKPVYLPFEILGLIFANLGQHDRFSFVRACRVWYDAGYRLLFDVLEMNFPVPGEHRKYDPGRRWEHYRQLAIRPKTLIINDPVRHIWSYPEKLMDSVNRINSEIPTLLELDTDILLNIRKLCLNTQLVNVCGPVFNGVRHSWAFDLLPFFLLHCEQLTAVEIEVTPVGYRHYPKEISYQNITQSVECSTSPEYLYRAGLISEDGLRWSRVSTNPGLTYSGSGINAEYRLGEIGKSIVEQHLRLSQASITLSGRHPDHFKPQMAITMAAFRALGLFKRINKLEVRHLAVSDQIYCCPSWFPLCPPGPWVNNHDGPPYPGVTELSLECGEDCLASFKRTLRQLDIVFPNLRRLSLKLVGIFSHFDDPEFLLRQTNLKHFTIRELTTPSLDAEEGPDNIHATNLLVECMQRLLISPNLEVLDWNRAGSQELHAEISWANPKKINFVDIWLTIRGDIMMAGERYDAWDYHEELLYGIESEEFWEKRWIEKFMPEYAGIYRQTRQYGSSEMTQAASW
ncbi:hypothetical protein H072_6800 [Dactylellina haptotyla CBS 200.50]|uniref:F-box domain-containing protein n=1 Tax=Dactylellina haptotyla (strain CBS 200.50) TaxID=1284197 RepID=S8A982_DACHA|nr:hypothetical protein H072_6800 [Dactylellina haptotyla CBS 200.50]